MYLMLHPVACKDRANVPALAVAGKIRAKSQGYGPVSDNFTGLNGIAPF